MPRRRILIAQEPHERLDRLTGACPPSATSLRTGAGVIEQAKGITAHHGVGRMPPARQNPVWR